MMRMQQRFPWQMGIQRNIQPHWYKSSPSYRSHWLRQSGELPFLTEKDLFNLIVPCVLSPDGKHLRIVSAFPSFDERWSVSFLSYSAHDWDTYLRINELPKTNEEYITTHTFSSAASFAPVIGEIMEQIPVEVLYNAYALDATLFVTSELDHLGADGEHHVARTTTWLYPSNVFRHPKLAMHVEIPATIDDIDSCSTQDPISMVCVSALLAFAQHRQTLKPQAAADDIVWCVDSAEQLAREECSLATARVALDRLFPAAICFALKHATGKDHEKEAILRACLRDVTPKVTS